MEVERWGRRKERGEEMGIEAVGKVKLMQTHYPMACGGSGGAS